MCPQSRVFVIKKWKRGKNKKTLIFQRISFSQSRVFHLDLKNIKKTLKIH